MFMVVMTLNNGRLGKSWLSLSVIKRYFSTVGSKATKEAFDESCCKHRHDEEEPPISRPQT